MRKINAEFAKVCIKKDGRISQRARYLFETDKEIGRYYLDSDVVVLHPWHVSSGRGFSTIVDNAEQIRGILRSIKCNFIEGNDAPRGGKSGAFISIRKIDLLDGLIRTFGVEKGRKIYRELGVSPVLTEEGIESLKNLDKKCAVLLSSYYFSAWKVLNLGTALWHSIAVFPDEE